MRVLIEAGVFESGPLALLAITALADDGRHTLLTHPAFEEGQAYAANRWLAALPEPVRRRAQTVLDHGVRQGADDGTSLVRVTSSSDSDWRSGRLTAVDALRLLATPLKLLLENRRNDLAFLLAIAPACYRDDLTRALGRGWVEPEQGGGLEEIGVRLTELATAPENDATAQVARLRLWVMFDRDADPKDPRQPSRSSERVRALCRQDTLQGPWSLTAVQLARRSIESYLPTELLRRHHREREHGRRLAAREHLFKLDRVAYYQYDMKRGLRAQKRAHSAEARRRVYRPNMNPGWAGAQGVLALPPPFAALPSWVARELAPGFGSSIGELYANLGTDLEPLIDAEYERGPARTHGQSVPSTCPSISSNVTSSASIGSLPSSVAE